MRYLSYKEQRQHGTLAFPMAYYFLTKEHPRYRMILHWHPESEFIRVLSGKLKIIIDNTVHMLEPGTLLYIPGGCLHSGHPLGCCYECLVFDLRLLQKDTNACTAKIGEFLSKERQVWTELPIDEDFQHSVDLLFQAMSHRREGYEFLALGSLYTIFGLIIRKKFYTEQKLTKFVTARKLGKFKKVLQFIEENYSDQLTLATLAELAGMDSKYFCTFFKQMTGRPPIDYLNAYRIECACEQFATTSFSIIDVAYNVGFHDASYFTKTFRKYKGVCPREYLSKQQHSRQQAI
ncbi:MAG: AraC family transcriptional regulator [Spirochaetia bacterium]|nr:AraC family transcriptional regulator [Spirochaetia bacterium]